MKQQISMNIYKYPLISIFFISIGFSFAQNNNSIFHTEKQFSDADSNKLFFRIENTNLIKNNEYFNNLVDGSTLIGYFLKPSLLYYPGPKTKIQGGVHLLKYSGIDNFTQAIPTFTFHYNITNSFSLILGTLYGTLNHQLIEPVFQFEKYIENNIENGLQILVNSKHFESDTWLNWEKFIFQDDPFQEEFTVGTSNKLILTNPESKINVSIPFQALIAHKGGQIDASEDNIQTLINSASGIICEFRNNSGKFIKSFATEQYLVTFDDISPTKQLPYIQGYGFYSKYYINTRLINLMLGYWYGDYFIAPRGEPLFQSVSQKYTGYVEPQKQLIVSKLFFQKAINKDINLGIRFESYYDLINDNFDFSYGLHIVFNRNFFLKKINYNPSDRSKRSDG